jgi:phosphoribosyl-AMP cyclohydrolase / phosphoribosyl-ATP pyrophosphohydrolase
MHWLDELRFDSAGLIPVVAQERSTGEVLMVAYANRDALQRTLDTGLAHYFSRSRSSLWQKGETSGHVQHVEDVRVDCDGDSILYRVRQEGPACHTLERSCFHRAVESATLAPAANGGDMLSRLEEIVRERDETRPEGSYTSYLFAKGLDKILKKVGEETTEVVIAGKNEGNAELRSETADLLFHLLVLLRARGLPLAEVWEELESRFGKASRIPPGSSTVDRSS